jgi:hypothetical protein
VKATKNRESNPIPVPKRAPARKRPTVRTVVASPAGRSLKLLLCSLSMRAALWILGLAWWVPISPVLNAATRVVAWGDGLLGQAAIPEGLTNVIAIAAGAQHGLALRADGTVAAWGDDTFGPTDVPTGLSNVVAIAAGGAWSIALKADGTFALWGVQDQPDSTAPGLVTNVAAVAAGGQSGSEGGPPAFTHLLALRADGTVAGWGSNLAGEGAVPVGLRDVVAVACGLHHNLALKADGTVVAWGAGQTIDTGNSPGWEGGQAIVPAGLSNVVAVAGGIYHSLALQASGAVVTWGSYVDHHYPKLFPARVPSNLGRVKAIAASEVHSVALRDDGTVVDWNPDGSLCAFVPPGLAHVTAVAAGADSGLALVDESTGQMPPAPEMLPLARTAGSVRLRFATGPGSVNQVQRATLLPIWRPLANVIAPANGLGEFIDSRAAENSSYYRVIRIDP